jgi:amino acid transporter
MSPVSVPEEYNWYIYPAIGMMIGGVVAFVASLFIENAVLLSSSAIAIGCGFFVAAGIGFVIIRRKRKNKGDEVTTTSKIIIITAYLASVIFIADAAIITTDPGINTTAMVVIQWGIFAALVIGLIIFFVIWDKRNA